MMTKLRLIILSDLFGDRNSKWVKEYQEILEPKFEIQYYDVSELAGIHSTSLLESDIHNQFLNGGIDRAVTKLLQLETEKIVVLGFSIGGTIAWKASLQGLNSTHLFAVSSTRLRYEVEVPNCDVKLYFGEEDSNRPDLQWFFELNLIGEIMENHDHQLYKIKNIAFLVCDDIIKMV
ncbi:hypothetical protein CFS9_20450 [Flavobacterium sp. CFS9]|uniref:Alpha/beta hydrolase n=1 Tax=Flavobacterium sp. CFS9 TaxID=3143118 RepID=A0AAT9H1N6_9FLAO